MLSDYTTTPWWKRGNSNSYNSWASVRRFPSQLLFQWLARWVLTPLSQCHRLKCLLPLHYLLMTLWELNPFLLTENQKSFRLTQGPWRPRTELHCQPPGICNITAKRFILQYNSSSVLFYDITARRSTSRTPWALVPKKGIAPFLNGFTDRYKLYAVLRGWMG